MSAPIKINEKGLEAAYEAASRLPLRDFNKAHSELDTLRIREGVRAAIQAYLRVASKNAEPVAAGFEQQLADGVISRLVSLTVGTCSCSTISPELKYHADNCRYRVASEALELARPLFTHPSTGGEGGVKVKGLDDDQIMEAHEHAATVAPGGVQGGTIEAFVAYKDMRSYDHVELMERVLGNRLQSVEEVRNHSGYLTGWNIVLASPEPSPASEDVRVSPSLEFCLDEIIEKATIMMTGQASYIQHILKTAQQAKVAYRAPSSKHRSDKE